MFTQQIFALALAALGVGEHTGGLAIAETYPSKPIKLIVPLRREGSRTRWRA